MSKSKSNGSTEKWAIVTGVSLNGVGYYVAKGLAQADYNIVIASRTESKTQKAIEQLVKEGVRRDQLEFQQLDVGDLKAVKAFAEKFLASKRPLKVLVNNAGVYNNMPKSPQGLDGTFSTNYLGPYYLTELLVPALKAAAPARVVNVASMMHRLGNLDFETASKTPTSTSYSHSKLYMILAGRQQHRRLVKQGIAVYSLHPGAVNSAFYGWLPSYIEPVFKGIANLLFLTAEEGAAAPLSAALDQPHDTPDSLYLTPYQTLPYLGPTVSEVLGIRQKQKVEVIAPSGKAQNDEVGEKLVKWSDAKIKEVLGGR